MKVAGAATKKGLTKKYEVMKNFLFPRVFHIIGWILFVPAVVFGLLIFINAFDISDSFGIDLPCGAMETVINDAVIIGIA